MRIKYLFIYSIFWIASVGCSIPSNEFDVQEWAKVQTINLTFPTYFIPFKPCSGCMKGLELEILSNPTTQFVIFVNNTKEASIWLKSLNTNNWQVFLNTENTSFVNFLDQNIFFWIPKNNTFKRISNSSFYKQNNNIYTNEKINEKEIEPYAEILFPEKITQIRQVKQYNNYFFIHAIYEKSAFDYVQTIYITDKEKIYHSIDLYKIGKSNKYPLGILDYEMDGESLFIISSMELIKCNYMTGKVLSRKEIEIPHRHLVDDSSFDFQLVDSLFLVPIEYGFSYYFEKDLYKLTKNRYLLINKNGQIKKQFGKYPEIYTLNSFLTPNPSAATLLNNHIIYYFYGQDFWKNFALNNNGSIDKQFINPQRLDINYCDSLKYWYEENEGYIPKEHLNQCLNSYYKNISITPKSLIMEYFVVEENQLKYHFEYMNRDNREKYQIPLEKNVFWVENRSNQLLFYQFKQQDNKVQFFN